jgi:dTMP kinase
MFISFEGTEGVGKSTLIGALHQALCAQHHQVLLTREPGGTPLAEKIRALLLASDQEPMAAHTELLLLYAARTQHLQQVILPALAEGKIVLCDRFVDASIAYQCGGRGLERQTITLLNQHFVSRLPDLTFWLDAPVEVGMQRASKRAALDRFEQEHSQFFGRVRAEYQQIAAAEPQRVVRLDAQLSAEHIAAQALAIIMQRLAERP